MKQIADTLAHNARALAHRYDMFPPGAVVLALVSGGADSVALLRLLTGGAFGELAALEALHVNHLLRGAESDADEVFVMALCAEIDVPCRVVRYDVAAYASAEGLNLEDAGRRVRYRFAEEELDTVCDAAGAPRSLGRIAVAHSLDDRIETFFMRAISGAGTGGLASIAPVRGRVVRPLLGATRTEIRDWLRELAGGRAEGPSGSIGRTSTNGVLWREDASNLDTERVRARIRHEMVPLAEALNPRFRETLSRSMDLLADDDALLTEMAEAFARDFAGARAGAREIAFERGLMLTLSRTMARRTVRAALATSFPEASRLDFEHVDALVDGLADDAFARHLPGGLRAFAEYGKMVVAREGDESPSVAPALLPVPGNAGLGDAGRLSAVDESPDHVNGTPDSIVIDASKVDGLLVVDSARPGDRMRPFGMDGTRKLSDMLTDAKVPARRRPMMPVVRDGERIVWLAGVRMSEEYRVGPDTTRAIRLTWDRTGGE